jgi:hypothetical protein
MRATSVACPSRTARIRPVSRSETSADPSWRNASPHGDCRPVTTSSVSIATRRESSIVGSKNQPRQ